MMSALRWLGLALLGILIAAAVSIAASRLASQQIGLASQPISAGDALAPGQVSEKPPRPSHSGVGNGHANAPLPATPPATPEVAQPVAPSPPGETVPSSPEQRDDSGGSRGSDHSGGGADD